MHRHPNAAELAWWQSVWVRRGVRMAPDALVVEQSADDVLGIPRGQHARHALWACPQQGNGVAGRVVHRIAQVLEVRCQQLRQQQRKPLFEHLIRRVAHGLEVRGRQLRRQ